MKAVIFRGKRKYSFTQYIEYVLSKAEKSVIIDHNNIMISTHERMSLAFILQSKQNKRVRYPALHLALNFRDEERKGIEISAKEIIRKYLENMGWKDSQYIAVWHKDVCGNPHCHIVMNMVTKDGARLSDSYCIGKSNMVCRKISNELHSGSINKTEPHELIEMAESVIMESSSIEELQTKLNMEFMNMSIKLNRIELYCIRDPGKKICMTKSEMKGKLEIRRISDLDISGGAINSKNSMSISLNH